MEDTPTKRRKLEHSSGSIGPLTSAGLSGSSFVLQTAELLKEESIQYETELDGVDGLLHKIKASVENIQPHEPLPILEASSKLFKAQHIKVPYPQPKPSSDSNYKVSLEKPTQFNVVGSYVAKTMIRSQRDRAVDMIVVIPETMLQAKDYLDLRYFYKRAYFLAVIASHLQKELGSTMETSFECLNENPLLPVLSLTTKTKGEDQDRQDAYRIRIIPCAPEGFFPAHKLSPEASLVRQAKQESKEGVENATPFYNTTLKAESCFLPYLRLLRQAEKKSLAFRDACILGRIWLQQRGLGGAISAGGFGAFEWSILLALLLQGGGSKSTSLSSSLTSTQLFKAMIRFLSAINLAKKPYILGTEKPEPDAVRESGPVLHDSARHLNLAFKMNPGSASMLQQHAKWTHALLSSTTADPFTTVFITKADAPLQTFDLVLRLLCGNTAEESADRRGLVWDFALKSHTVLTKALGDRARLVHVSVPPLRGWSLQSPVPAWSSAVQIGILFDPVNMSRQVDHGPTSEEKEEAREFRQFWGSKSELRRFADGSIMETLIWKSSSPSDLCEEIVRYALELHLGIGQLQDDLAFFGSKFAALVPIQPTDGAAFSAARKAFSSFERDLRDLEDLPLHVRQVAPIAADLRYASITTPFTTAKSGPRPMEVILSFEVSGKWPENLAAVQRTKAAFLLKIGSSLEAFKSDIKTYPGLEGAQSDIENLAFLDVVYESGASFRMRIHSELEESLLERRTKDQTLEVHQRTQSSTLLADLRRQCVHLPLINQTITTFVTRFPALSPTIRLVKHWFNAHKLASHYTEEFAELVTLAAFLRNPVAAPSSANRGFLQTLLFLAQWDWRTEPLVVDTSGEMSAADHAKVVTRLEAWRAIDPNMHRVALVVATSHDLTNGTAHTTLKGQAKPSKVVAARMTALARSASNLVKVRSVELEAKALFTPSLKEYNVLIKLNKKVIKGTLRTYQTDGQDGEVEERHSKFKNLDGRTAQDALPLAQHPVTAFFEQLETIYADTLLFFRGAEDDDVVGAIWNPQLDKRKFKPSLPSCYMPQSEDEGMVELNKQAILGEIARIGGDMITSIEEA